MFTNSVAPVDRRLALRSSSDLRFFAISTCSGRGRDVHSDYAYKNWAHWVQACAGAPCLRQCASAGTQKAHSLSHVQSGRQGLHAICGAGLPQAQRSSSCFFGGGANMEGSAVDLAAAQLARRLVRVLLERVRHERHALVALGALVAHKKGLAHRAHFAEELRHLLVRHGRRQIPHEARALVALAHRAERPRAGRRSACKALCCRLASLQANATGRDSSSSYEFQFRAHFAS